MSPVAVSEIVVLTVKVIFSPGRISAILSSLSVFVTLDSVCFALLLVHVIPSMVISVAGISFTVTFSAFKSPELVTSMINCFGCPATYLLPSTAYLKMPRLTFLVSPLNSTDGFLSSPVPVRVFTIVSVAVSLIVPLIVTVIISPAPILHFSALTSLPVCVIPLFSFEIVTSLTSTYVGTLSVKLNVSAPVLSLFLTVIM